MLMKNKHTSSAALLGFLLLAVPIFFPEFTEKCDKLFKLAVIYGFVTAGDATGSVASSREDKRQQTLKLGIFFLLALPFLFFQFGCASSRVTTKEVDPDTGIVRTTEVRAHTFFDSKSELAKPKATITDKTATSSAGAMAQESSGSNAVQVLKIVVEGAASAAVPH